MQAALFVSKLAISFTCGSFCGSHWCGGEGTDESTCNYGAEALSPADECCKLHDRCCGNATSWQNPGGCNLRMVACLKNLDYSSNVSYWDGHCGMCPLLFAQGGHCSGGGQIIGNRGCGFAHAGCEARCGNGDAACSYDQIEEMHMAMANFASQRCCGSERGESFTFPGDEAESTCGGASISPSIIQNTSSSGRGGDSNEFITILTCTAAAFVVAVFINLLVIWRRLEQRQRAAAINMNSASRSNPHLPSSSLANTSASKGAV
jgi:prepilin-type processing-associated H-X9-DG protein